MKKFGVIGRKLGHSYSPQIHAELGDYAYGVYEMEPEELESFLHTTDLDGFNVTIPYKKAVIPHLCRISREAELLGSVNTVVRTPEGLYGDNTDYYGFSYMLEKSGFSLAGKKALVLGNGGVCPTVCAVLSDRGAGEVVVISRSGENNYDNLDRHADAALIVNTTPVGMYPEAGVSPLETLDIFPRLECVLDLIYNPFQTALMAQAQAKGIASLGGISMLVAQAKRASELFVQTDIADAVTERVVASIVCRQRNIVLIGMPGCGKSTLGRALAKKLDRTFVDTDEEIVKEAGRPIPEIFANEGEDAFRRLESRVLARVGKQSAQVIATGGGVVTREENYPSLSQNGVLIFIERELSQLARDGRPLSLNNSLEEMYAKRLPLYRRFADGTVFGNGNVEETTEKLMEAVNEISCTQRT